MFTLIPDDSGTSTFHFVPFDESDGEMNMTWRGHVIRATTPSPGTIPIVKGEAIDETTREQHRDIVEAALQAIERGELEKVVVSRTQVATSSIAPETAFKNLCRMHPTALVYLMHHPTKGTWCGASPELLLRSQQHDVDTVSLAGTRAKESSIQWSNKEKREQHIVTEHIVDVMMSLGLDDIRKDGPNNKVYGDLVHLETRISARYSGNLHALAKALHPTPAVCGHPSQTASHFIRTHERHQRSYYSGFLGWSSPLGCAYYVNLRCAHWATNGIVLFAGGGIVEGSEVDMEWEETNSKLASIAPAFQA